MVVSIISLGVFVVALRSFSARERPAPDAYALWVDEVVSEMGSLRQAIAGCGTPAASPAQAQRLVALRWRIEEATDAFAAGDPATFRRVRDAEADAAAGRAQLWQALGLGSSGCSGDYLLDLEQDMADLEAALRARP